MSTRADSYADAVSVADRCLHSFRPAAGGHQFDFSLRKVFARNEFSTVIDQRRAITQQTGESRQRCSHMARAANHQAWLQLNVFKKNLRLTPLSMRRREVLNLKHASFSF